MRNVFRLTFLIHCVVTALSTQSCGSNNAQSDKADESFKQVFDGQTLKGWKGDSTYWKVENGNLVGIVTPETILKANSFIVWQGGQPENFELKLAYRISPSGNSGINYRSVYFEDRPYALQGYQCDIDGKKRYVGQNYEEKKRTTLAYMGEKVRINPWIKPDSVTNLRANVQKNCWQTREVLQRLGENDSLKAGIRENEWNQVHLVVQGSRMQHYVNGILMSEVIDEDTVNRASKGYIGVQVHVGPPMKVEYRDILLKEL